jgi:hypothetical protein
MIEFCCGMIFIFYQKYRYISFGKPVYFNGYFAQFTGITGYRFTGNAIPAHSHFSTEFNI